jgi:hypothetical protein
MACRDQGILRSLDGGDTWFQCAQGICPMDPWYLWAIPSEPAALYATGVSIGIHSIVFADPFDVDLDGQVSAEDALQLALYLAENAAFPPGTFQEGDFNNDGSVTVSDLLRLRYALVE